MATLKNLLTKSLKSFIDSILQRTIQSSHKQLTQSTLTISQLVTENSGGSILGVDSITVWTSLPNTYSNRSDTH